MPLKFLRIFSVESFLKKNIDRLYSSHPCISKKILTQLNFYQVSWSFEKEKPNATDHVYKCIANVVVWVYI